MGLRGPAGKRDEERRRRNAKEIETTTIDMAEEQSGLVEVPEADEDWHPVARSWYSSLAKSGQSRFYEPSDWAVAYVVAGQIDLELKPRDVQVGVDSEGGSIIVKMVVPMNGSKLTAILKGFTMLMATEGDRRRLSIEINRDTGDAVTPEGVTNISSKRRDHLA